MVIMVSHRLSRLTNSYLRLRHVRYNQPVVPVRYKSSTRGGMSTGLRFLAYGLGVSSVVAVGTIVCANRSPQFRSTVESKVPRFGSFVDSATTAWQRVVELGAARWDDIKNIANPGRSKNVGLPVEHVKPDISVMAGSPQVIDKTKSIVIASKGVEMKREGAPVAIETLVAMDTSGTKTTEQSKEISSSQFVVEKEEAAINREKDWSVKSSEDVSVDTKLQHPVLQPVEPSAMEGIDAKPVKEETHALQNEDRIAKDSSPSSLSESEARVAVENELRRVFLDYVINSDYVIASLMQLAHAVSAHHLQVLQAVGTPEEERKIEDIAGSVALTEKAVDDARRKVERAKSDQLKVAESLTDAVSSAVKTGKLDEVVEQVCTKVSECLNDFSLAEKDVEDAEKSDQNWQKYLKELEESKEIMENELKMPLPKMDSFQEIVLHMMSKKVEILKEKLSKRESEEKQRTADLLITQQERFEAAAEEKVKAALKEKQEEFNELLSQLVCEAEKRFEDSLKEKLVDQASAHSFHLRQSLKQQAEQLNSDWSEEMSSKLAEVESQHQLQMSSFLARLRGINSMISTVAVAGETARREQSVHAACNALYGVLIAANCDPDPHQKHTISKQVLALRDITGSDQFISTVLGSIPKQAITEGISSETGLRTRFDHVRRVCRRVALVPEEGGGLGTYLLSFIQSLLTIDMIHSHMVDSHSTEADPFVILCHANDCLQRGDLEMAVRWVNQLEGEPKRLAKDWLKDACTYLETRQAVLLVSEYLAASLLSFVR